MLLHFGHNAVIKLCCIDFCRQWNRVLEIHKLRSNENVECDPEHLSAQISLDAEPKDRSHNVVEY